MDNTIQNVIKYGKKQLKKSSETPLLDSELIMSHLLKISREELFLYPERILKSKEIQSFEKEIQRRKKGEPVAYITNKKEFFSLDFFVNKHVLIPRPETEIMVEHVLEFVKKHYKKRAVQIIDIGTGSGCIAISLGKSIKNAQIIAVDICKQALTVTRKNIDTHGMKNKIQLIQSNLLKDVRKSIHKKLPLIIVANLPYVKTDYILPNEVAYEPEKALYSGEKGLDHYFELMAQIGDLHPKAIFFEIDPEQVSDIKRYAKKHLTEYKIEIVKDFERKNRIIIFSL